MGLMDLASLVRSGHATYDIIEKSALGVDADQLDEWEKEFRLSSQTKMLPIAEDRKTDPTYLGAIALSGLSGEVVMAAASNPSTCKGALVVLAYKPWDSYLRKEVAGNPSTPSWTLTHLSHSGDAQTVEAVAKNTSTPVDVLCRLVLDTRYRRAAMSNLMLPEWVLTDFASIGDSDRSFARSEINRKREALHDLSFRMSIGMVDMMHHGK